MKSVPEHSKQRRVKHALFVAFHFPPVQGSSGVHRITSVTRHLLEEGWNVTLLTVAENAYESKRSENLDLIPEGLKLIRVFSLNAKKHLSIRGHYLKFTAIPDQWSSWIPSAVVCGLFHAARTRFDVVVSTYPIASAHCIGGALSKILTIPWVADFRDPMAQKGYPADPTEHRVYEWIERRAFVSARSIVVATPGSRRFYMERYGGLAADKTHVVANGFNDNLLVSQSTADSVRDNLLLLHSGTIYPSERDPRCLFQAIAELNAAGYFQQGILEKRRIEFRFRGTGDSKLYTAMIGNFGIDHLVTVCDPLTYQKAFTEIAGADGLLLLQAENCNDQIPAKAYEYLHSGRPILVLAPKLGDTGQLMVSEGIDFISPLDSVPEIKSTLQRFISALLSGQVARQPESDPLKYSRKARAREFLSILDEIVDREEPYNSDYA